MFPVYGIFYGIVYGIWSVYDIVLRRRTGSGRGGGLAQVEQED